MNNNDDLDDNLLIIDNNDNIKTVNEPDSSGTLVPIGDGIHMNFGDGRRNNLKYYQYTATASQIGKKIKNDLDEGRIEVDFEDVEDVDSWKPSFSFARLWYVNINNSFN